MAQATIVIVDDDELVRKPVRMALEYAGHQVEEAATAAEAQSRFRDDVDLFLLDYQLPDLDGFALLKTIRSTLPDSVVIMMTAHASVDRAVEAMRLGAFHYATKPVELDKLLVLVDKALETTRLRREVRRLRADRSRPFAPECIIGSSPTMTAFKDLLMKVARSPAGTVLLLGESGTGKGLAARVIHHNSPRRDRPFMNITCSALPATLLESELFGHERGAFTDAKTQKPGLLELADGGTVFLDDFTEMDIKLQAKLLRFLEDRSFKRLGGTRDIQVDVRVIGASNREMEEALENGHLRKDLYYRLQGLSLKLPPLRERMQDVPLLADYFIDLYNREYGRTVRGLSEETAALFASCTWEGNIRELRNAIERAMLFCEQDWLSPSDFPMLQARKESGGPFRLPDGGLDLEELERSLVVQALERTAGNRTQAAVLLGLTRDQIRYRIEKFGLD